MFGNEKKKSHKKKDNYIEEKQKQTNCMSNKTKSYR